MGDAHVHRVLDVGRRCRQRHGAAAIAPSRTTSPSFRGRTRARRASPSTASRRTVSASRISAAGPASASWRPAFPARRRWRRRQLVRVVPARLRRTPAGPRRSATSSRCIPTMGSTRRTTGASTPSSCSITALRYEFTQPPVAGGDQYSDFSPTKPNPAVNNYPGALMFAGDGPGREGTQEPDPRLLRRHGAARRASRTARTTRRPFAEASADRSGASRSCRAAATSPDSSASTCSRRPTPASRRRSCWIRDCRPIRCRRRSIRRSRTTTTVDWWNGQEATPSGGVRQLDGVDAARSAKAA